VTASGATPGYTYLWTPGGATTSTAASLAAGSYSVVVKDANNCTANSSVTVNNTPGPSVSVSATTNVSCNGGSNGTATATVVGGTGAINYAWSPSGGNAATASGLPIGTYTVNISDANGCLAQAVSATITQPFGITITVTPTAVSCFSGSNGGATALAGGGTPGFTYLWQPSGSTGATISGQAAGTYTVQATDTKGCVATQTYIITQPAAALTVSSSATPTSCFGGANGTASSTPAGGTTPYTYTWMPGSLSGQNISGLIAGTYTVNVTDANGCTASSGTATVTQPTALVLVPSSVNSTCGNSNGQAIVTASGATPGYTYLWTPGGATTSTAASLAAGSYSVVVKDANNCTANSSVTVNNTPGPSVSVSATTNVSCNGGSNGTATATVVGGTGAINYAWSPSGGNAATATGLPIGTYTVDISDANGCIAQAVSTSITQPPAITINVVTGNVSCFNGSNGTATAAGAGGTPGYTYLWQPSGSAGATISGQVIGNYTVQATDINGCTGTQTYTITQPTALSAVIDSSFNVSCFGGGNGSASAGVSGGTPGYTYSWAPSGGNAATAINLSAGTYTVNILDTNSCPVSATIIITEPAQALTAVGTGGGVSCFGGSDGNASVTPSGGTPSYTYSWSPAGGSGPSASNLAPGNYFIQVTDANSCQTSVSLTIANAPPITGTLAATDPSCGLPNGTIVSQISGGTPPYSYSWSPGGTTGANLTGAGAGIYTVQVTDALNCIQFFSDTLTNIPGPVLALSAVTNDSCFGNSDGTATINIVQGVAPFTTSWSPSGGSGLTATSLPAGTYTATVTDALGCPSTITATVTEPTPVVLSVVSVTNVSCFALSDGAITAAASGGTPGYSYSWSPVTSSSATVDSLIAGTYTVSVSDTNSCSTSISVNVTQPTILTSSISSVVNAICYNATGNISVLVNGGTIPYAYSWSSTPVQTGSTLNAVPAGSYTVTVTDTNGCVILDSATITQPALIITTVGANDTICLGQSGSLSASATGGSGGYYYAWQPGGMINNGTFPITPSTNTTYTVIAYDQNGCAGTSDTATAIVYTLNSGNVQAYGITPVCPGVSSTIYAAASGNTGPLTYTWDHGLGNGPGAFLVTPTQPTTYVVTISNSCAASMKDSVQVLFTPQPTMVVSSNTAIVCVPGTIQFSDNSITGNPADPINSWYWTFGDGTSSSTQNPSHAYTVAGTYTINLTVGTNGGCTNNTATGPLIINAYNYPVASFTINSNFLELPFDALICTNTSTGAVTYNWNFGDGSTSTAMNPTYLYSTVGIYPIQLISTNQYGCADTAYSEVTTDASITFPTAFTPNPDGPSGGSYNPASLNNDVFFPYTSGVTEYLFQVFDRWGELIFESTDIKTGWDGYYRGKLCQQD
ncbi:MAG: PKD domain-containing protein, partial [Bacteroidia bacterium]